MSWLILRFRRFPFIFIIRLNILAPQSEYRPTEYMQIWMRAWLEDDARLLMAKYYYLNVLPSYHNHGKEF